jgi:bromodomain-containing factor 1
VTKRQAKEITKTLNHITQTLAGQSFKAPVEQLWPKYADAYAAKVPNPIDLGTIEMKLKNNIYSSMNDIRADVILLYQNSVDFNGTDHIITSAALEVQDTILKAISDIEEGKNSTTMRASARGS